MAGMLHHLGIRLLEGFSDWEYATKQLPIKQEIHPALQSCTSSCLALSALGMK